MEKLGSVIEKLKAVIQEKDLSINDPELLSNSIKIYLAERDNQESLKEEVKKEYKKYVPTEEQLVAWSDMDVTANQSKLLLENGYTLEKIKTMSKLDAYDVIRKNLKEIA